MPISAKELYLDLLKKSLCGVIYDEPPVPAELYWCRRGWLKRRVLLPLLTSVFGAMGARVCFDARYTREQIELGRIWPAQAHTMIGLKRMDNLGFCLETILKDGIPGDLIETGVWRGGACIFMKGVLAVNGITDRRVYVADSFRGLPKPNEKDYPADSEDQHHEQSFLAVSRAQVEANFKRYDLLDAQVVFLEGWFKDTLPHLPDKPLSLIRLDGDMYESTMDAFRHLYPRLAPGGFCIIDDYFIPNCRQAVQDYRAEHRISEPMTDIDGWSCFWRKNPAR